VAAAPVAPAGILARSFSGVIASFGAVPVEACGMTGHIVGEVAPPPSDQSSVDGPQSDFDTDHQRGGVQFDTCQPEMAEHRKGRQSYSCGGTRHVPIGTLVPNANDTSLNEPSG
jgi:hypothetical protein